MHLSDAISRLSEHDSDAAKSKAKPIANFNISTHEISEITGFKSLTLQDIKEATIKDCQLTKLKTYIVDGFPKHKHECAEDIDSFFDYRESHHYRWNGDEGQELSYLKVSLKMPSQFCTDLTWVK